MKSYGFNRSSRQLFEEEIGFDTEELDEIEHKIGISLNNTFDTVRERSFETLDDEQTTSKAKACSVAEKSPLGVEIVLEYDEDFNKENLAHEAVHGNMLMPDGNIYDNIVEDRLVDQQIYAEFVAYLAEDQINPLKTSPAEMAGLWQTQKAYHNDVESFDILTGNLQEDYKMALKGCEQAYSAINYQEARKDILAQKAAEEYSLDPDMSIEDYVQPDENLYQEVKHHIDGIESNVLAEF